MIDALDKKRGEILGVEVHWHETFVTYVPYISVPMIRQLIDEKLIYGSESCNHSYTVQEFLEFMEEHPNVHAQGYVISQARQDHRGS